MYKLGMVLLKGHLGQQQSVCEAIIWLNRAAERADAENPHALHELAFLHEYPPRNATDKIIRDEAYSLQLYEQAAKLGYAKSQTRLGKAFEQSSLGMPQDDRASIHWFSKAAAQGDPEAEDFHLCGHTRQAGSCYCGVHTRRAHKPGRVKGAKAALPVAGRGGQSSGG